MALPPNATGSSAIVGSSKSRFTSLPPTSSTPGATVTPLAAPVSPENLATAMSPISARTQPLKPAPGSEPPEAIREAMRARNTPGTEEEELELDISIEDATPGLRMEMMDDVARLAFEDDSLAVWIDEDDDTVAVRDPAGMVYEVEGLLGRGMTGEVFKVSDMSEQFFAMKVVKRRDAIAESAALHQLRHPNVVRLVSEARSEEYKQAFLFFEFIEGGQLCDINEMGELIGERFTEDSARAVLLDLVSGVAHLHQNNVVHRDIKPSNCLRRLTGSVVLCDFGASEFPDDNDLSRRAVGTPFFYPPEACSGKHFGTRAQDAWALGVTLYLLLFGRVPYGHGARNMRELLKRLESDTLDFHVPGVVISPECRVFLEQTLQKDMTSRLGLAGMIHNRWLTKGLPKAIRPKAIPAALDNFFDSPLFLPASGESQSLTSLPSPLSLPPFSPSGTGHETILRRSSIDNKLKRTYVRRANGAAKTGTEEARRFSVSGEEAASSPFGTPEGEDGAGVLRVLVANDDSQERNHLVRRIATVTKNGTWKQVIDVCGDSVVQQLSRGRKYAIVFIPLYTLASSAAVLTRSIRKWENSRGVSTPVKVCVVARTTTTTRLDEELQESGVDRVLRMPAKLRELRGLLKEVGWATKVRREMDRRELYDNKNAYDLQCLQIDRGRETPFESPNSELVAQNFSLGGIQQPSSTRRATVATSTPSPNMGFSPTPPGVPGSSPKRAPRPPVVPQVPPLAPEMPAEVPPEGPVPPASPPGAPSARRRPTKDGPVSDPSTPPVGSPAPASDPTTPPVHSPAGSEARRASPPVAPVPPGLPRRAEQRRGTQPTAPNCDDTPPPVAVRLEPRPPASGNTETPPVPAQQ
eukprot:Hpha_TRINITY_DN14944_c0_g1::TRINITY_DN14944_c0_g1_i1::g.144721::m.144721